MSAVFDSSALLAIVFDEDGAEKAAGRLSGGVVTADCAWAELDLDVEFELIR